MSMPVVSRNLVLINGPLLLGTLFGYGLFGLLLVQVFMYHGRFPGDCSLTKALVWTVFIADIILTVLPTVIIWHLLISGWGELMTIGLLEKPFIGLTMVSGYVTTTVHIFFSWRIWKLCGSCILPYIIVGISFIAWGMELVCGIQGIMLGTARVHELEPFVTVWLTGSALCDVAIAVTLVSILIRRGTGTGFKKLSGVIRRLIRLTVETGTVTALAAICQLTFFLASPRTNLHFLPFLMLAKLYSNSLLATLNARSYINSVDTVMSLPLWEDQLRLSVGPGGGTLAVTSHVPNGPVPTSATTARLEDPGHSGSSDSDISLEEKKRELESDSDNAIYDTV